ncbi:MAG: GNAT family N-acetyltransferase [Flavobacteriaceae bacterium]|nr:GNAT family N-acetyltransferase [Bacteroidia bacterium]NNL61836.1 GNAT family N-acetyltransferase [Flavobacteriaceae bacterium]
MKVPILENDRAKLIPLTMENYSLVADIASENNLIQYSPSNISTPEALKDYVKTAINLKEQGKAMPFLIHDNHARAYAGCTRFGHIDWKNKVAHIGWTWIGKSFQGTGLNRHVKNLMIDYLFNDLEFDKLEFRIDERNLRSRRAVEKLGAHLEGILRSNTIMQDGFRRNSCCYGILKSEWSLNS